MLFKKLTLSIIGGSTLLFSSSAFAQIPVDGFFPKKNSLVTAASYTYKSYDEFYIADELTDNSTVGNFETINSSIISIYAQYGITDRISATVTLPYISVKNTAEGGETVSGIQDLGLYVKGLITDKKFANYSRISIGGAMGVSFPLSNYDGGGLLSIGNTATSLKSEAIVLYETPLRVFAEAKIGSSINSSSDFVIPPALIYNFKLGYIHRRFYAHTELSVQNSISGTDIGGTNFGGPETLPETEVDFTNLLITAYVPILEDDLGVSGNFITVLDGRNVSKESGFGLGVVYNFK